MTSLEPAPASPSRARPASEWEAAPGSNPHPARAAAFGLNCPKPFEPMDPTPRPILHIEDEDNDIHLLQRALVNAEVWSPVQVVKNAARAFAYLLGEEPFAERIYYPPPGLILLDLSLPSL